jgi:hypothetical protein
MLRRRASVSEYQGFINNDVMSRLGLCSLDEVRKIVGFYTGTLEHLDGKVKE